MIAMKNSEAHNSLWPILRDYDPILPPVDSKMTIFSPKALNLFLSSKPKWPFSLQPTFRHRRNKRTNFHNIQMFTSVMTLLLVVSYIHQYRVIANNLIKIDDSSIWTPLRRHIEWSWIRRISSLWTSESETNAIFSSFGPIVLSASASVLRRRCGWIFFLSSSSLSSSSDSISH